MYQRTQANTHAYSRRQYISGFAASSLLYCALCSQYVTTQIAMVALGNTQCTLRPDCTRQRLRLRRTKHKAVKRTQRWHASKAVRSKFSTGAQVCCQKYFTSSTPHPVGVTRAKRLRQLLPLSFHRGSKNGCSENVNCLRVRIFHCQMIEREIAQAPIWHTLGVQRSE